MLKKLRNNTLLTGTAIYLVSNILNAAIPFTLLPILTRYLTVEEYGQVAMFQTWVQLLTAFVGLSMQGAAVRKFYDSALTQRQLAQYIGSCLQILLVTTSVACLFIVLLGSRLEGWLGLPKSWVFYGLIVSSCLMVFQIRLGQWQVRKQAKQYGFFQVTKSVVDFVLSLVLVVALIQGAQGRISAQVWAASIFAIISLLVLNRDKLLGFVTWRPDYIMEALRFGVPLIPHVGGAFLLASIDRFVINMELGLAEVGIYMVAVQFGMGINLIFDAVNKAYVPWLFEKLKRDNKREKQQIVVISYAWYGLILIGAALAFLIGPWMIPLIAGSDYVQAGKIFGWVALGQGFGGMYLMVTNYIFYSKRTGLLSVATIVSGLINVGLMLIWVPKYGIVGAAYSFCVAMAIRFFLTWWVAQKRHPMPWFSFRRIN